MEKALNRKIKRLWKQRLLVAISGVAALGFSVLQLQAVIRHRSPQPSWTLDLSEAVAIVIDEESSEREQEKALLEIQEIAQKRGLSVTRYLAEDLAEDLSLYLAEDLAEDLGLYLALDQVRDRVWELARYQANDVTQALDMDQEMDREVYSDTLVFLHQNLIRDLSLKRLQAQAWYQVQAQAWYLDRVQNLAQDLDLDLAQDLMQNLVQELNQEVSIINVSKVQTLSQDLVHILEQVQAEPQSPLIVRVVSAELKQHHQLPLYRANIKDLRNKETIRARTFHTSIMLLTASLLILLALRVVLSKIQLSYRLALNSHLIAFLPEECAAELGALKRRMQKQKASVWHIRLRLLQEFLILLWVFYIQVKMDNLGLPPSDRSTDD